MAFRNFKQYFNKERLRVIHVSIITLAVIIAITVLFSIMTRQKAYNKIDNFMNETTIALEQKIDEYLYTYLQNNLEYYIRPSNYSLYYESQNKDLSFYFRIQISLLDSVRLADYFTDIALYRAHDSNLISALNTPITLDRIMRNDFLESLASYYESIINLVKSNTPPDKPQFNINSNNEMTYIYPVHNINNWRIGETYLGLATLYLKDPASFFDTKIEQLNSNGTFLITNNDKILLTDGDENTLSNEIIFDILTNHSEKSIINKKIHSTNYIYYYVKSPSSNITYHYYEQAPGFFEYIFSAEYLSIIYILALLLVIVIYILICFSLKLKSIVSFNQLKAVEEYKLSIEKSNRPQIEILKDNLLSIDTNYKNYSLIIFEPDISFIKDMSKSQKEFFSKAIIEQVEKTLQQMELPNVTTLQPDGFVITIINHEIAISIREFVNKMPSILSNFTNCKFNIYYTAPFSSKDKAVDAYPRLRNIMKYSLLYNYPNILSLDKLEKVDNNTKAVDTMVLDTIKNYLMELDIDKLIDYLKEKIHSIRTNGYSYNQTIDYLNMVFCSIKNYFMDKSLEYDFDSGSILEQLNQLNSLEECINIIEQTLNTYKDILVENNALSNKKNMDSILRFIDDNIEEVTLSAVADEFNITSAHLSRTFKDNMGINFSEYVTEKKLIRATELLKENTDYSIADIANKLGYNTASYFSSKFKDRFGVTPGNYKKNILRNK